MVNFRKESRSPSRARGWSLPPERKAETKTEKAGLLGSKFLGTSGSASPKLKAGASHKAQSPKIRDLPIGMEDKKVRSMS